jgi:hypothetical protein
MSTFTHLLCTTQFSSKYAIIRDLHKKANEGSKTKCLEPQFCYFLCSLTFSIFSNAKLYRSEDNINMYPHIPNDFLNVQPLFVFPKTMEPALQNDTLSDTPQTPTQSQERRSQLKTNCCSKNMICRGPRRSRCHLFWIKLACILVHTWSPNFMKQSTYLSTLGVLLFIMLLFLQTIWSLR